MNNLNSLKYTFQEFNPIQATYTQTISVFTILKKLTCLNVGTPIIKLKWHHWGYVRGYHLYVMDSFF
jgi:hypothetical protein